MKAFILLSLLLCGCASTKYVEKNSEELSKAVFAAQDSINAGRFDLADQYINSAARLVSPPKERIKIISVYE